MNSSKVIDNILLFVEVLLITFFFGNFIRYPTPFTFFIIFPMFIPLYMNLSRRIQERKSKEPEQEIVKNESGIINK
jgi:hypothetical protein